MLTLKFDAVEPAVSFTATENEHGNIELFGLAEGIANGTAVNLLLIDAFGNSKTASAVVMDEEFSLANIWAGMFGAGNVNIIARVGGVQKSGSVEISGKHLQAPVSLTSYSLDERMMIDVQGVAPSLMPDTVLTLIIRDVQNIDVTATALVLADGSFSVQDIDIQGLSEGLLTFDAIAQDVNGLLNLTNLASLLLTATGPEGADSTLNALEDTAYVVSASALGYNNTPGHTLTGVKITQLPTNGILKLNGVAVSIDEVISRSDLDSGKLIFQGELNGNGSNYASFQFKVQDSRSINNEDTTANTLVFNLGSVNDAPTLNVSTVAVSLTDDQVGSAAAGVNLFVAQKQPPGPAMRPLKNWFSCRWWSVVYWMGTARF
jgi:hypothetical protein